MEKNFRWSEESEPHKLRTKEIIKKHPEIRELIGRNPYTSLVILFCVGVQLTLAVLLKRCSLVGYFCCSLFSWCVCLSYTFCLYS
ncbi:MAG: hypothetical protein WKG06_15790 [Segetibacter sp.]